MKSLPEALAPLAAYPQFILWISRPSKRPGATDKLPIHPTTGAVHDAHDPAIWLTADQAIELVAARPDTGVGFVFTDNDPFFFLDIDKCFDPETRWSEIATQLCEVFNGAAVEISQSGTGLHIIGSGAVPPHGCKDQTRGLELYTTGRFVALTGTQAIGSAAHSHPEALEWLVSSYFPPSQAPLSADWTSGPCGEWNGPESDEELISKMLASKSVAAAFGGRASVQALWTGDVDALTKAYPDGGGARPFDHSAADAALCQHLAFWTGKDCERIDRLFRQSELTRDKWIEREDYRRRTILHAVGYCKAVYGTPRETVAPVEPMASIEHREGYQFLAITQQAELFKGCIYIRDLHRIFTDDGALLKPEQFRAVYGGYVFALESNASGKTTKNAWEAFTESQGAKFPKAHGICFRPEEAPGATISEEGRLLVNVYKPIKTPRQAGDATPFLDHLAKVLPVQHDRSILLAYMAACVQYPGIKFQWTPLLQGCEGNGKTLFINCLAQAVGNRYTHLPNAADLSGNGAKFNAWIQGKLFIGVEEVYVSDRREVLDALKPLITNPRIEIQGKGVDQITGDNRANFVMCSNHKDAILKTQNDRRFCVFYTAQQNAVDLLRDGMGGLYFPNLYRWLKAGGYAVVTDYLTQYPIADELNPAMDCHRAPITSSTSEAVGLSLGGVEQEILEAIDEGRHGFKAPWISSRAFDGLLEARRDTKRIPPNKRREILKSLGYDWHPGLKNGRVNSPLPEGGKPRLYIRADHIHAQLTEPASVVKEYIAAQGAEGSMGVGTVQGQNGGG